MWKAELRIEGYDGEMKSFGWENEELDPIELVGLVNKKAREVSKNNMLIIETFGNESIVYRDGAFVAGYANFWEEA